MFQVGTHAVPSQVNGTLKNHGPDVLYYRDEHPVSATLNDGSLTTGQSVTLDGTQWLISASRSTVSVVLTPTVASGGAGILSGVGAPGATTGSSGQFYVDTTAGVLYGPKAAGVWPAGTLPFGNTPVQAVALPVSPGTYHTFGAGVATGTKRLFNLGPPYLTASRNPAIQVTVDNQSQISSVALQAYDVIVDLVSGNPSGLRVPRILELPSCPPGQPISFQIYGSPIGLRLEIDAINDIVDPSSYNVGLQAWAV